MSVLPVKRVESMNGGAGHVLILPLYTEEQMHGYCRLYAQVTLEPGCEIGWHIHHNEAESYFVVSGCGEYNDNGNKRIIKVGDVTYTPDGCGHGLLNTSKDVNLVIMANIIPYAK